MILESIVDGRHITEKAHLRGVSTSENGSEVNRNEGGLFFEAQGTVELRDLRHHQPRFQSATPTWNVPSANLLIMRNQILAETQIPANGEIPEEQRVHRRPVYFQILGSKSVANQALIAIHGAQIIFNCVSGALKRLKFTGRVLNPDTKLYYNNFCLAYFHFW